MSCGLKAIKRTFEDLESPERQHAMCRSPSAGLLPTSFQSKRLRHPLFAQNSLDNPENSLSHHQSNQYSLGQSPSSSYSPGNGDFENQSSLLQQHQQSSMFGGSPSHHHGSSSLQNSSNSNGGFGGMLNQSRHVLSSSVGMGSPMLPRRAPLRNVALMPDSPFVPKSSPSHLEKYLPAGKRRKPANKDLDDDEAEVSGFFEKPKDSNELLFTVEQVRAIVAKAVSDREAQLREEYDAILEERLTEQFDTFSRFNQDYIHKKMTESTFNYLS